MLQAIESAIRGMRPQKRPGGIVPLSWLPMGMVSDAPGYRLYRGRSGSLWVQVNLGITGDVCWYGPIAKDDPRHAQLMAAAESGAGIVKALRSRLGRMIGQRKSGGSG